ncbi:MAG: stage II sporulation protein M [Clostridiales bacterium]|jgi:stage II sporulation protein M|nr:stage II sporulation protein M [Clostridiales bacterium]
MRYGGGSRRKRFFISKKQAALVIIIGCFLAGIAIGAVAANTMEEDGLERISGSLTSYLGDFEPSYDSTADMLRDSVFKYAKLVVLMWLLAFAPAGGFAVFLLVMTRGAAYGFTWALLLRDFGLTGALSGAVLCLPQGVFVVPLCVLTALASVNYVMGGGERAGSGLKAYGKVLAVGLATAFLAGAVETFLIPLIADMA